MTDLSGEYLSEVFFCSGVGGSGRTRSQSNEGTRFGHPEPVPDDQLDQFSLCVREGGQGVNQLARPLCGVTKGCHEYLVTDTVGQHLSTYMTAPMV